MEEINGWKVYADFGLHQPAATLFSKILPPSMQIYRSDFLYWHKSDHLGNEGAD